ncbi:cytochrome c oxidase assembly factor COX20 lethal (3) 87Df [Halictus rubicundus]|uniref:cytochrome c oxidase assembly factor COX20 lethal (3) 87Df n=1 Tax=Halictus rubicundus TaxID=77578 RepID=UPI0040356D66
MSESITNIGEETPSKLEIKLFGIPIIQTKCQGDSHFYGIIGGVTGGLMTYLFTSQPRISSHMGVGCYAVTTVGYAIYCLQQQRQTAKQMRLIQAAMYEATSMKSADKTLDELPERKSESV